MSSLTSAEQNLKGIHGLSFPFQMVITFTDVSCAILFLFVNAFIFFSINSKMDISESVGMGPWQLPPLLLTLLRGVPSAMLMMIINFAAPRTRIWCNNDLEDHENFTRRNNLSENESATLGECWTKTNDSIVECKSWGFDHSVFSWTITEEVINAF